MNNHGKSFDDVIAAIDDANARDPKTVEIDGRVVPVELLYGRRMSDALARMAPNAPELLRIAVRGQHIERWTSPRKVDGHFLEGFWRAHQVPLPDIATKPAQLQVLESWMRSYRPEELFDQQGRLNGELAQLAPTGQRRMGANPNANGGGLLGQMSVRLVISDSQGHEVARLTVPAGQAQSFNVWLETGTYTTSPRWLSSGALPPCSSSFDVLDV